MLEKDFYFEKIRGVCIIAVVLIHSLGLISQDYTTFTIIFRQFINFPVAVFFFISGYFTKKSSFLLKETSHNSLSKKVKRILIPYFIWSLFSLIFFENFYNFNIKTILVNLFTGQIVGIYYFIIVLVQLIFLTPILMKFIDKSFIRNLLLSLTPISLIILYLITLIFNIKINFPYYALPFSIWFSFYFYGIILGNKKDLIPKISLKRNIIFYLLFLIISILEGLFLYTRLNLFEFSISQIKISSFLCTYFLINIFMSYRVICKINRPSFLSKIGEYSFGIYLIHIFILKILNNVFKDINLSFFSIPVVMINTFITITLCYLLIHTIRKIIGNKFSKKLLGF